MSALTDAIEQRLSEDADLYLAVTEDNPGVLVVSGLVESEELRQAAMDIVHDMASDRRVVDDIEVEGALPHDISELPVSADGEQGLEADAEGDSVEPGDFSSQDFVDSAAEAAGPTGSLETDDVSEGDQVYVPPVDPPRERGEFLGGTQFSSMDDLSVERSSDGTLGDEAIRDAILRELREDAATTDLTVEVDVIEGLVKLSGMVPTLDDAEAAEEVASRVPGVVDVEEELEVANLQRRHG